MKALDGNRSEKGLSVEGKEEKMAIEENRAGHRKMIIWQNLDKIEDVVEKHFLRNIPKNLFQLRDQIERSSSSSVANFIEGYYSGSIKEYIKFLGYSRRSLAELQDWGRRTYRKGYVNKEIYAIFDDLCIKTIYLINRLSAVLKQKTSLSSLSSAASRSSPLKPSST